MESTTWYGTAENSEACGKHFELGQRGRGSIQRTPKVANRQNFSNLQQSVQYL